MFVAQSVLHSFTALIIIEMSFHSWEIRDHLSKLRYRLLILILPILGFPFYQLINPERGSMYFRENNAIFDINRWLSLRILDTIPVYGIFFLGLLLVTLIFFFQEIFPIIREKITKQDQRPEITPSDNIELIVEKICGNLKIERPSVMVVSEQNPLLYTTGTRSHTIVLSTGLLQRLDHDQLESALFHEIVHMLRGSNIKTQIIYLLRMLMFYNPVSMVEFRRLVQDDEFVCDSITVSYTKRPDALASAIKTFYTSPDKLRLSGLSSVIDVIESHSHNILIDERIRHIGEMRAEEYESFGWGGYILTVIVILKINYMVV